MKRQITDILTRSLIGLLLSLLLLTTSGFSIYSHHCSHEGLVRYSVLLPAEPCSCDVDEPVSCCGVNAFKACDTGCEEDCCKDKQQFNKLDIEGYSIVSTLDFSPLVLDLYLPEVYSIIEFTSLGFVNVLWQLVSEPPPPHSVNKFLSIIQLYLN